MHSDSANQKKPGIPTGDAIFNTMPPGEDISNQPNADIREMPMRKLTDLSYPGDGGGGGAVKGGD